jgi:lysophospholipase L1-like esterase
VADGNQLRPQPRLALSVRRGELKPEYQPNSTIGGPGDKLHPNRAGYAAMGSAVDLRLLAGRQTAAK